MTVQFLNKVSTIIFGFLAYLIGVQIVFFAVGITIYSQTLPILLFTYLIICLLFAKKTSSKQIFLASITSFVIYFLIFTVGSAYFAKTYDTTWDGQGYHSSGVIALKQGWNPVWQTNIGIPAPDGDALTQGYPKFIWILQAITYSNTNNFNSSKAINIVFVLLAILFATQTLAKLGINLFVSFVLAATMSLAQPVLIQLFSFMQDGTVYLLYIISLASFVNYFIKKDQDNTVILNLGLSLAFLLGSKYSALVWTAFYIIAFYILKNYKPLNIRLLKVTKIVITIFLFVTVLFTYVLNIANYGDALYPTGSPQLNTANFTDNTPKNLLQSSRLTLLFYSIFSQSQQGSFESSNVKNIAVLKNPFFIAPKEAQNAAEAFNNRVGAGGPIFAASVVAAILLLLGLFATAKQPMQKKAAKYITVLIVVFVFVAILNPRPNLLRYTSHLMLVPFLPVIVALIYFKNSKIAMLLTFATVFTIFANSYIYNTAILAQRQKEFALINAQLADMKTFKTNFIKFNNFYSNKIRLQENNVPFEEVNVVDCLYIKLLLYTSGSTKFCKGKPLNPFQNYKIQIYTKNLFSSQGKLSRF